VRFTLVTHRGKYIYTGKFRIVAMAVLFTRKALDYCRSKRSRGVVGARAVALSVHVHCLFFIFTHPSSSDLEHPVSVPSVGGASIDNLEFSQSRVVATTVSRGRVQYINTYGLPIQQDAHLA
jgi:hypothetical protein